jgi:O-acetyl-ADP-ribose deacetylase (regulator of RNase III)
MTLRFETGNITKATTEAIVNAANSGLKRGGGVCGAIFDAVKAAGGRDAYTKLTEACDAIGHCSTGNAVITPSFGLPATHIIHAVGPIWSGNKNPVDRLDGGQSSHIKALADTYRAILRVCRENNLKSVTIPAISTGIYGFPEDLAAAIAVRVCAEESGDIEVTLIGYNQENTGVLKTAPSPRATTLLSGLAI